MIFGTGLIINDCQMRYYGVMNNYLFKESPSGIWAVVLVLSILEIVLRGIALWRSAQKGQKWWFIFLLLVNSLGVLPLIYLFMMRDKKI
jgi:hypothetical protein